MPRLQKLVNQSKGKSTVTTAIEGTNNYASNGNVTDNPYQAGTPQFDAWQKSWADAGWRDLGMKGPSDAGTAPQYISDSVGNASVGGA